MPYARASALIGMLVLLLFAGCRKEAVVAKSFEIEGPWSYRKPLEFTFQAPDTINLYNLFVDVRITNDYAYSNLWLFVTYEDPAKNLKTDTLDCPLAYPNGKWIGTGLGDIIDTRIQIKKDWRFKKPGMYRIKIKHGMRHENLEHIRNLGILIEKTEG